jgi:hypothetical protein
MIYCLGNNGPTVEHDNIENAVVEAKRICSKENRVVKIMQIVAEARPVVSADIIREK